MHEADKTVLVGLTLLVSLLLGFLAVGVLDSRDTALLSAHAGLHKLEVDGTPVWVEVAHTPETRARGLSERETLLTNQGMLFVFEEVGIYPIWMRNMQFPLDIYWISSAGVVVDMWQNARPESYPSIYTPKAEARYVLEVIAGFSEVYNIHIGSRVDGLPEE